MTEVLSIQMRSVGHKTYAKLIRDNSGHETDLHVDSYWVDDERSALTKVVRKLAEFRIPRLNRRNLDFRRARAEWATGNMSYLLARKKTHAKNYDVLHFHTQTAAFGSVSLMKSIPTVITIDMTAFQLMREHNSGPEWTYRPNVLMERNVFEQAAHIIAFSQWARDSVIREFGVAPERLSVITPGVLKEAFHQPQFLPANKPKILFVGNEFYRKGGDDLIAVFAEHFAHKAELHLMTNDSSVPSGESVFVHRGVAAYTPEWHRLYQESEVFVMTSRAEALGLVFQEAAASGLALIGSQVGGIPEMIDHDVNGFLIAPGDRQALRQYLGALIDDPALRARMRIASYEKAMREFNARTNTSRVFDTFRAVGATHNDAQRVLVES
ncbi:glycosyltransferase family 4 protein [Paraburkholderia humisilvae]|uniref:D-inositol-3-phosphate glycosyltransferase n=1 Tax=Paraburkholderia humisilvae TaxID=627669 RepID=A0A6J5DBQ7_9BURK|nr:glycosyltransferase family 4 protein [Paraburkholderia humisilvae]CAB3750817.1 D-inositol-3-phosphate glycosyltransferase [Paraburkholderia humisilvae]